MAGRLLHAQLRVLLWNPYPLYILWRWAVWGNWWWRHLGLRQQYHRNQSHTCSLIVKDLLVIDLGGLHVALQASVNIADIPNLVVGNTYNLDFFICERHTTESGITYCYYKPTYSSFARSVYQHHHCAPRYCLRWTMWNWGVSLVRCPPYLRRKFDFDGLRYCNKTSGNCTCVNVDAIGYPRCGMCHL